jgi:hypothetical protein
VTWCAALAGSSSTDWVYGPTALVPEDEPEPYRTMPLDEATRGGVMVR